MKGWKKIFHTNGDKKKKKKAGVAILISDKKDFEIKAVKRGKEGYYIIIKGSIQEEDITIINICTQHRSTAICKANSSTIIVGDFNTHSYLWIDQLNIKLARK